ncbi:hypothetical protein A2U01_0072714, partial [Trifolium medium]|nr:hypothetical protein [Trifolium medium]
FYQCLVPLETTVVLEQAQHPMLAFQLVFKVLPLEVEFELLCLEVELLSLDPEVELISLDPEVELLSQTFHILPLFFFFLQIFF